MLCFDHHADPARLTRYRAPMHEMLDRILGEDIELQFVPGPELRKCRVDPGQIDQVLMNLAVNARDAMPDGGTLTVAAATDGNAETLVVRVTDTGHGIPEADLPNIFEPFYTKKIMGRTICALGDAAAMPVTGFIKHFRDEFQYHIDNKRCMV